GGAFLMSAMNGPKANFLLLNGTWCVGRPLLITRVPGGTSGSASVTVDLTSVYGGSMIQPGETRTFQFIYRDSLNNQNPYVSSAVSVTFQ
ncbi:MAG TPA: hypothetical protein QF446_13095, partial [Planctomycetota bacterium]|nr:hypothetical protein [Planctomycetota bacterium]